MNLGRGFFRIWILGSVIFVGTVGVLSYEKVSGEFTKASLDFGSQGILLVPVNCKEARGTAAVDYSPPDGPWTAYNGRGDQCWYQVGALRRLYPEFKDLTDDAISDRLYKKAGIGLSLARPWEVLGWATLIALGIPASVLLLGVALGWAIAGFRTPEQDT